MFGSNGGEIPDAQTSTNSIRVKLEAFCPNHCTPFKPLGQDYENSCMYIINHCEEYNINEYN